MEFHQLTYTLKPVDPEDRWSEIKTEWFGSQRAAAIRRLELHRAGKLEGPKKNHPIEPVEVPTRRKADLLAWLNRREVI